MDFKDTLLEELKDPEFAVAYLADAINEGDMEGFLLAVRDLIDSRGGITKFSKTIKTHHRVSLYKAFSKKGNPLFSTVVTTLNAIGIGLVPYLKNTMD